MADNQTKVIDETTPLLVIAGPMFIEVFMSTLLNNIDTLMLGHYSENAVGAVGNANNVMFMLLILLNIIATATSVVVAQYLGAKQYEKMNQIYTLAMAVNFLFGIFLSLGIIAAKGFIMNLLSVSPEMRPYCAEYINIVGGAIFIQACSNVMLQILRCNGFTKIGMNLSVISNLLNIGGNYLFLYGALKPLNMGVSGVGISTVAARTLTLFILIAYFYKKKIGRLSLKLLFPFPGNMLTQMVKIGLPSAGENLSYNLYQMVLLSFINKMGNDAVNAKIYCNSITSFATVFGNACAMATQIIVGHLVGAGKQDAAYKRVFQTLKLSLAITLGLSVLIWLTSPFSLRLFTSNEVIIKMAFYIMLADIFVQIGRCTNLTAVGSLKAAGDYMYPFIVGLFTMWGIGVPVGYVLGVIATLGVPGIIIGTASDECIRGVIVMVRWYRRKWEGKAIVR